MPITAAVFELSVLPPVRESDLFSAPAVEVDSATEGFSFSARLTAVLFDVPSVPGGTGLVEPVVVYASPVESPPGFSVMPGIVDITGSLDGARVVDMRVVTGATVVCNVEAGTVDEVDADVGVPPVVPETGSAGVVTVDGVVLPVSGRDVRTLPGVEAVPVSGTVVAAIPEDGTDVVLCAGVIGGFCGSPPTVAKEISGQSRESSANIHADAVRAFLSFMQVLSFITYHLLLMYSIIIIYYYF